MTTENRDHGGGLDAATARFGGSRIGWIDLSTGINPQPYPVSHVSADVWTALPDQAAQDALVGAARTFWNVPEGADVLAAPGASALIAALPALSEPGTVTIPAPTYNEHAAAFGAADRSLSTDDTSAQTQVLVHPNNPDGRLWRTEDFPAAAASLTIIDESFCDVLPDASHIALSAEPGYVILKSFGKFWGLAGMRLGFAIAHPGTISVLRDRIGPWAVSGPALQTGATALRDAGWATATRQRLKEDSSRLDSLMSATGAECLGGTTLFRLYSVANAAAMQERLARHHIWSRIFPYSDSWIRLGLPAEIHWPRVEAALRA
ncbi:threonine-phosphate decarboxylase [uncultured Roseobacter sp.]|uniref:threonine-phosphate decarboxylase n=1 Tax=uncultured Roseobacter sp. TaxID=114847 RepID=UPI00262DFD97|nr:threonine-phosphate decarboxylase [uncultured Roseobacter sp.]